MRCAEMGGLKRPRVNDKSNWAERARAWMSEETLVDGYDDYRKVYWEERLPTGFGG